MPHSLKTEPNTDDTLFIRDAQESDMPEITEIYRHHVLNGTASFEEIAPDVGTITTRFDSIRDHGLPYLIAEHKNAIVGYCYASLYRPRSAYRHTVENSIYLAADCIGLGIGSQLMSALIARCEAGPWRQMIAAVGDSANVASIRLHQKHGFTHIGVFKDVGFKFDRWLDSVLMQRPLNSGMPPLPHPMPDA